MKKLLSSLLPIFLFAPFAVLFIVKGLSLIDDPKLGLGCMFVSIGVGILTIAGCSLFLSDDKEGASK